MPDKANYMPGDQGIEGELLRGRPAGGPPIREAFQGRTNHGGCRADGGTSARRAISVYLFHAHPTLHSQDHAIDVFA